MLTIQSNSIHTVNAHPSPIWSFDTAYAFNHRLRDKARRLNDSERLHDKIGYLLAIIALLNGRGLL